MNFQQGACRRRRRRCRRCWQSQQIKSITMPWAIPTGTLPNRVRATAAVAALDADFYGARGMALKPTCRIRNNSITAQHHN